MTTRSTLALLLLLILTVCLVGLSAAIILDDTEFSDDLRLTTVPGDSNASVVAVDTTGALHIVWQDNRDGNYELYYTKVIQDLFPIQPDGRRITYHDGASQRPSIALDVLGNIHIAWQDNRDGNWEIYYKKLSSTGVNLTDDERISNDPAWSLAPSIAVDSHGVVSITWYDNLSGGYDLYYTTHTEPDLCLQSLDASSTLSPEGTPIELNATVANLANGTATNVVVTCFIDMVPYATQTINLDAHENTTVVFTRPAEFGRHHVLIAVDPQNALSETAEDNNNASVYVTATRCTEFTNASIPASATVTHSVELDVSIQAVPGPQPNGTIGNISLFARFAATSYYDAATIRFPYTHDLLGDIDEASLRLSCWNPYDAQGPSWQNVTSGVNTADDYVWATVNDFGIFAPVGTIHVNQPPSAPGAPMPPSNTTNVSRTTELAWTGADPDNDTLVYDVYFGTSSTPGCVSHNQSATTYIPGTLAYSTTYYWRIVAWDAHGASSSGPVWDFSTITDLSSPVTSHQFFGALGNNSWYQSNVTIILTAMDAESGVNHTFYQLDNGDWLAYDSTVVVLADGTHTVSYFSDDVVGNVEPVKGPFTFKIDKTKPLTSHSFSGTIGDNGWYVSSVTITLTASDLLTITTIDPHMHVLLEPSGVNHTYYRIDDGNWIDYNTPVNWSLNGLHSVSYYSVDNAGNLESINGPFSFKIDRTAPAIVLTATAQNLLNTQWLLEATASDDISGIAKVDFYVDGGFEGSVPAPGPYEWLYEGFSSSTTATAFDMAGNTQTSAQVNVAVQVSRPMPGMLRAVNVGGVLDQLRIWHRNLH